MMKSDDELSENNKNIQKKKKKKWKWIEFKKYVYFLTSIKCLKL